MIRADLHVHSRHSSRPPNWLARQFNIPESFTTPQHIYRTALSRGMTHVTITDHNTIDGCLEIATLPNTFISCELTARFPEDDCHVHVLTYELDEARFSELNALRDNIYELAAYIDANRIPAAVAHPLFSVNDRLAQWHFERLLVLFDLFELNGFRSPDSNVRLRTTIEGLTRQRLEDLATEHGIANPKTDPLRKHLISGSDDHSGLFVARSHTSNPGNSPADFFGRPQLNEPHAGASEPVHLAYAIYSILYHHLNKNTRLGAQFAKDAGLRKIVTLLTMQEPERRSWFIALLRRLLHRRRNTSRDAESLLRHTLRRLPRLSSDLTPENAPYLWFNTVSTVLDRTVNELLEYTVDRLKTGDFFNIFRSIGSISSLYFLSAPYYAAYRSFQDTRQFGERLNTVALPPVAFRAVHLTDTSAGGAGAGQDLRDLVARARGLGLDHTVVTCANVEGGPAEAVFRPVDVYDVPECPDVKLACPPVLEIVDYCFRQNFTHIHSATPGPVGLVGLLAARLLNRPFYATHDRTLTQYARRATGDRSLEGLLWTYMRWFYNQAATVFVPSGSCRDELLDNGIRPDRIVLLGNGVDTERFRPRDWSARRDVFTLLYVGRVARENGLDVLGEALQQLRRSDVRLVVAGEGPYRDELRRQLTGLRVEFPGALEGDDLVRAYREADLLIIPSAVGASSPAVLEAQACAVPVVIRDGGREHTNIIPGETGIVFASDGARALARDIESILDRPSLMRLGLRARELLERNSTEHAFFEQWRLCQQP